MYSTNIFLLVFILVMPSYSVTICDSECVCNYDNKSDQDILGEVIDCSYKTNGLKANYTLPNLVHSLDLSSNNITELSSSLLRSKTMVALFLNNNEIKEILPNVLDLPELLRLDLSDNQLEFIHEDTFNNIKKLEYLNLANNAFTTFDKLTFHHLSNLKELILNDNNIGPSLKDMNLFDRNAFGLTHKIQSVSISGINLNKVPDNFFADAYDIRKLTISRNNLTVIFEIPFSLEYLDLSYNPIIEISMEDLSDLPGLKELKMNNLQIKEIGDFLFSPLHGLKSLELERNKNLTRFSKLAFGQEVLEDADDFQLEKLSLKGSGLKTLDEQLIEPFGRLIELDLQGNPWRCDCKLAWLKKLQMQERSYEHLRCATPLPLFNSRIHNLTASRFICPKTSHYIGVTIALVSLCALLTTVAMWLFFFLPKYQSRCAIMQNMYSSTAYSVLPMGLSAHEPYE